MGKPVYIDDHLYEQAKAHAQAERRTIAEQIEFWAMVGKAALENPDLPTDFVRDLLVERTEGRALATPYVPKGSQKRPLRSYKFCSRQSSQKPSRNYINPKKMMSIQPLTRSGSCNHT